MSGKQNITIGVVKPNGSTTIVNENNVDLEQRLTAVENAQGIKTGASGKIFVVWTRIGYEYEVTYPLYYINGQAFPAGSKKITLEGSHATLDRTDTFGLNASGAFAIAGNPAAEPIAPTVDTANEIFITTRDVKANTVEPEADPNPTPVADVVVYKQNVEWQTTATSAGTNFNHTGEPFEGTKAIRLVSIIKFKDTVNIHDASQFDALRLKLLQNYQGSGYSAFTFKFLLNDTVVSSSETITSGIDYPFFKNPAVYETVLVDFNRFAFTSNDFNSIEITPIKPARFTGASLIDNVVLIAKSVHVVSSNNTIDTSYFVRKDSFHFNPIDTTGVITDLDISTKEGSGFTFIGTVTELHSLHNSNLIPKYFYGQDFYIKNDQATPFIIKHNSGVIQQERYIFLFPNEEDLEIQPKEIFHFKAIMTEYNGGTLEFVGKVVDLGNLIATAEEKLTIHDDDKIGNADSEDSNKTKFWKFSTIKTNLKTFFDNLYKTWILDIETTASVNYTLSIADIKKKTVFTATNPIALNVPTNATEAIAIGTKKSFTVQGTGVVTVQGAGITFVQKNLVFTTGDTFTIEKIDTDTWAVNGNLPVAGAKVPYTVFIDTVNGVDATGVIEDKTKPFKTDTAAYAALPTNNGNTWTFYFIDDNVTRVLSQFPSRKIMYVCYNTGTFDFSLWTGLTTIGFLYFEIPYATLLHNSATQTRFSSSNPCYINANTINIQTVSHSTGSSFFQMSGLIRANLITQRNTGNKIFFNGELIVETFDTTNTVLFSSAGSSNSKVNNLVLGGQSCTYGFVDGNLLIGKISGTGTLVIGLKNIDITGVSCPATINISLANGSCLTGVMSPNFLGGLSFQKGVAFSVISSYKGKLNNFDYSGGYTINIAIYNSYIITPGVFFVASASTSSTLCLIVNSVIEQTTPSALFTGVSASTPLTITKTGTFYSNATSLGSNVSIAASSLTSY